MPTQTNISYDQLRLSISESALERCFTQKPIDVLALPCALAVSFASLALAAAAAAGLSGSGLPVVTAVLASLVAWAAVVSRSLERFRLLRELVWRGLTATPARR